jgi:cytochrome P450
LRRDPAGILLRLAERYGDIVHFKVGGQHVYLLNHPDDVENVLVTNARSFVKGRRLQATKPLLGEGLLTSESALHLRQRRLIQPIFHRLSRSSPCDQSMG